MRVGLIDADFMWRRRANGRRYGNQKADIYPNLVLMKLAKYHKVVGQNTVEWYQPYGGRYDIVYISKVFGDTPDSSEWINADSVIYGGTGYCIRSINGREEYREPSDENYMRALPGYIEHIMPDYSLYPGIDGTAYGFLSRGCPRGCGFCHVSSKEGRWSYKVANLSEWWSGQKRIVLMDPNILACKDWEELLQQLADSKARVDINQGIDARLLTDEKAKALAKVKLSTIHFAWDDFRQKDAVLRGLQTFADNYLIKLEKGHQAQVFVLTNYNTTFEQDLERIYTLRDMHFEPYVMIYDKQHAAPRYKSLQRWVNMRAIFHKVATFEEYNKKLAKE